MKGATVGQTVKLILEILFPFSKGAERKAVPEEICGWVWVPTCAQEQRVVIFADISWLSSNAEDLWETPFTVHGSGKQNGWVNFPGTETLNFLWHFPVSLEKFLRRSYLPGRHSWLPTKDAESCLCGLNRLQLPSLSGVQKKTHALLPRVLLSPLQNCWRVSWSPKQGWESSHWNFLYWRRQVCS